MIRKGIAKENDLKESKKREVRFLEILNTDLSENVSENMFLVKKCILKLSFAQYTPYF